MPSAALSRRIKASHAMVRRGGQPDEAGTRRALNSMLPIRSAMWLWR
jgi:hypothetical protein